MTLSEDTTFTLTCTNGAGSDSAQTTIATTSVAMAPVIAELRATPSSVVSGSATDVTWVWSYANTPAPTPTCTIDHDVGTVTSGKATSVNLTDNTTFTLTCTNSAGSDEATVKITTTPAAVPPAIDSFSASPNLSSPARRPTSPGAGAIPMRRRRRPPAPSIRAWEPSPAEQPPAST